MEKTITVSGKAVRFKATGATMRIYRQRFQRDILEDMTNLSDKYNKGDTLTSRDLESFENIAYVMAKQGDPNIPDEPDEWLDGFDMFSIYEVLPEILKLWGISGISISTGKKKAKRPTAR